MSLQTVRKSTGCRIGRKAVAATAVLAGAAALTLAGSSSADAKAISVASTLSVSLRGNGHGHGMSQYGAQGAALKGRNWRQIVAFYYPHTTFKHIARSTIRVQVSGAGTNVQVAAGRGLMVSGVSGRLPSAGVARYRLLSNAQSGERLQRLMAGAGQHWKTIYPHLANNATFHSSYWSIVRVFHSDGTSIGYSGYVRAVRRTASGFGTGVYAINVASLDNYTAGVVPREMPASWQRQALDAQAIAARTYARYEMEHSGSRAYDICDTTMCQVYGGVVKCAKSGSVLWLDAPQPARDTAGDVLYYGGHAIFSQFSASNGGWTVDGGQPYLVAKADPYDTAASGDPYASYGSRVSNTSIARYFGLSKVTKMEITKRDGHGAGGGRVTAAEVWGVRSGKSVAVKATGFDLQAALGAGTTWITLRG